MDKGRTEALEARLATAGTSCGTVDALGAGSGSLSGAGLLSEDGSPAGSAGGFGFRNFFRLAGGSSFILRHRGDSGISEEPESGASSIELLSAGSSSAGTLSAGLLSSAGASDCGAGSS